MLERREVLAGLAALAVAGRPWAQSWPAKPIRLVLNFPPGGPTDVVSRYLAQKLSPLLGQPVVVDNRSGGAGAVGILAAANSAPDGYTLLYTATTGLVQVPLITKDASFDPLRSIVPVVGIGTTPIALLAHESLPASDFPGFVEWARKQQGGVDIGGGGPIIQIATAVLSRETGLKLIYVPYRGTAPVVQAALGGEIKAFFSTPSPTITELIKTGRLKVLGVTSAQPSRLVPGAEPIARYVSGYEQDLTYALFAPAGIPPAVAERVAAAVMQVLSGPGESERFLEFGLSLNPLPAAEVSRIAARDAETIRKTLETTPVKFGE
jgi:tripartite-type tricarboxylate transporter receptor subunit TctC